MLLSRNEAERILKESELLNPGPWANHCRVAALCAERIARKCGDLDAERAYIYGLMHDIGRRFGALQFGHIVDGYRYMMSLGYPEVARICLTHSFPVQDIHSYIGKYDVPESDVKEMEQVLNAIEYDNFDRLIQLCDSLASADGVVNMTARMDDVARRYHDYPEDKRQKNFELKRYFEIKSGMNIYEITSDQVELWGL